jgi:eukaryotic-like serine/threonine-protein kinase
VKKSFWSTDWFAGIVFATVFLTVANVTSEDLFSGLETAAYDMGMRMSEAQPSDQVRVIAIDDESIQRLGRFPWPRELQAQMIDILNEGGAKVIASTLLFSEPQVDAGQVFIQDLTDYYDNSSLLITVLNAQMMADAEAAAAEELTTDPSVVDPFGAPAPETEDSEPVADNSPVDPMTLLTLDHPLVSDLMDLRTQLDIASVALSNDARLAEAMTRSGRVVLPLLLELGVPLGRLDSDPPLMVLQSALLNVVGSVDGAARTTPAVRMTPPIPELGEAAQSLGHLNILLDVDGSVRFEALAIDYYDVFLPSFALQVAASALNLTPEDIEVREGEGLQLGGLEIGTTPDLLMYNFYYGDRGGEQPFSEDSFFDVLTGEIPADAYRDKVVLIGTTAAGTGDSFPTPVDPDTAPVMMLAHTVSAILNQDFITRPPWADLVETGTLVFLILYIAFILPNLRAGLSAFISLALLAGLVVTEFSLLVGQRTWLQLMIPGLLLVTGHLVITIKMFRVTERLRFKSEEEGAESNKMLGLAFQGQGQLDMAFEKFRKIPVDASVLDLIYNLALDFERKRQHNKAEAVYKYIADNDADYKDIQTKMKRSKALSETVMLGGGGGGGTAGATLLLDSGDIQKPMLGRYEVEKELGKGAMGIVYLGKDPKINRVVAIKTMALSEEFEDHELDEVKERFFREAETAGRLDHPSIVTIFDAGEEHDLAYIAMEFLKGGDLTQHIKSDVLLEPAVVMDLMAKSAEALNVAHDLNVVHRDIKPANMMYDAESGSFKVTDFGIARITDSSKTKTGMVLGTPSYMSPEQLSGKKVDGRSDLFSLGVTMYQLLSGQLPFQADSMASLMYKIANEEHPPLGLLRPELPSCVEKIVDKALSKDMGQRYQDGKALAKDIRACLQVMS